MRISRAFAIDLRTFSQSSGVGSISGFFFAIVVLERADDQVELSVDSHHEPRERPEVVANRDELLRRLVLPPPHPTSLARGPARRKMAEPG
jgi:hypothetical protein